jgi:uncharacterized protein involved in type VI secretion and phage assembly
MNDGPLQFGWLGDDQKKDDHIYGVAVAVVVDNFDRLSEARVQLSLPWAPGFQPWARVATTMAGMARGTYFIPQVGDEVLVAFNQGDIREPFVIGALWNTMDRPPALLPLDPVNKRLIRTPFGQQVVFDEAKQSVTINNSTQQTLTLGAGTASLEAGTLPPPSKSSVSLDALGNVTITGAVSITLKAPSIVLNGETVQITGTASATLNGGAQCTIAGLQIDIG